MSTIQNAQNVQEPLTKDENEKKNKEIVVVDEYFEAKTKKDTGLVFVHNEGRVWMTQSLIQTLYQPLLLNLYRHAQQTIASTQAVIGAGKKIPFFFLCGGFSASPMVVETFRKALPKSCQVVKPPKPITAVLKGALNIGCSQINIIARRVVKKTIGVCVSMDMDTNMNIKKFFDWKIFDWKNCIDWEKNCIDWEKTWKKRICFRKQNGVSCPMVDNLFEIFAKAGEIHSTNVPVIKKFTPGADDQECMMLHIYETDCSVSNLPDWVDDEDRPCRKLSTLRISMPDLTGGLKRAVQVSFWFGKTHIQVTALDETSRLTASCALDFS